jgi:hypothetical protein
MFRYLSRTGKAAGCNPHRLQLKWKALLTHEVDSILEHRFWGIKNPKAYYKVAWNGYGIEHNSWEPESNVVNAAGFVTDYWKRQAEKQAGLGALLHA